MKPDSFALIILAALSIVTITTSSVEFYGLPRMTVFSIPFTAYFLFAIRFSINPVLIRFFIAYIVAFLPSTIFAFISDEIKWSSVYQGIFGFITFMAVGSYFFSWLKYSNESQKNRQFLIIVLIFLFINSVEIALPSISYSIRSYFYSSDKINLDNLFDRETRVYGVRPTGFFSEPSNFARYIGIMMAAYLVATMNSRGSRWAFAVFMLLTRSISYFVAIPALVIEARRILFAAVTPNGKVVKGGRFKRFAALAAAGIVILAVIGYTQSARISDALSGSAGAAASVSGDSSLNERILIPMGYLFERSSPIALGLGPTPQDEVNDYSISQTRSIFRWQRSYDDRTAIAATILTIAGMGLLGLAIFYTLMYLWEGIFGIELVTYYLIVNTFSSGYNSVISLVPSGLVFGLIIYQNFRARRLSSQS